MKIDLGTCAFEVPDADLMVPVQLAMRGTADEMGGIELGPHRGRAAKAMAYSRVLQLLIEEIPEGGDEQAGLNAGVTRFVTGFQGSEAVEEAAPVEAGVARRFSFKSRGPRSVPLKTHCYFHVVGIVLRAVAITHLDAPHVEASVRKQLEQVLASLSPAVPRIVP